MTTVTVMPTEIYVSVFVKLQAILQMTILPLSALLIVIGCITVIVGIVLRDPFHSLIRKGLPLMLLGGFTLMFALFGVPGLFAPEASDEPAKQPTPKLTPRPKPTPIEPTPREELTPGSLITISIYLVSAAAIIGLLYLLRHLHHSRRAKKEIAQRNTAAWTELFERHDAIKDAYMLHTFDDLDLVLTLPMLQDVSYPQVVSFLNAYDKANSLRPASALANKHPGDDSYLKAVNELERAWSKALSAARAIGDTRLSRPHQQKLRNARQHWSIVKDGAATPAERKLHAEQLKKCMDALSLKAGEKPMLALEAAHRGELPAGRSDSADRN